MTDTTSPTDIESSTEIGTNNDDVLASGAGDDTIVALGGDDTIESDSGDDMIVSGTGDDTIDSGSGDDMIVSGKGDDTIEAGDGDDLILAGKGDDTIIAGDGNDTIVGGKGEDTVVYEGSFQDYDIDFLKKEVTVTNDEGDVDTLKKVEILSFDDADIYIDGTNNTVIAVADTAETGEDESVTINLLENDFDFEGDAFSLVSVDSSNIEGTVTIIDAAAGIVSYTPSADFANLNDGETITETFTYTISDGTNNVTTTVSVTVSGSSDIQVSVNDTSENVEGAVVGQIVNPAPQEGDVYSVSDDRFEVGEDGAIKLKPGVFLDYEVETEISLTVTLTNDGVVVESIDVTFSVLDMIEGSGQDGYISGAFLFADANGNGTYDVGEVFTYTDPAGNFSLPAGASGTLIMQGTDPISGDVTALDIATGLPFDGVMKAPPGSTVVSPLTTLVVAMAEDLGITYEEAEVLVKQSFNIDPTVDLNNFDAIEASREGDTNGDAVFAAGSQVLNTVEMGSSLIEGSGGDDAEESIYSALASSLTTTDAVTGEVITDPTADISDTATITEVIETAAAEETIVLDQALVDGATAIITESNVTVDEALADPTVSGADLLTDVTQVSVVSQGETSDALETADTTTITEVQASYTGDALDVVVASTEVGDVGGVSNITQDGETVTTAGDVTGDTGIRVDADDVTINNSGSITGNGFGTNIWGNQAEWGDVNGGITINARNNTTINNTTTGVINGATYGIIVNSQWDPVTDTLGHEGSNTTVNNDGEITGQSDDGVQLLGGGTINNTGSIYALSSPEIGNADAVSGWSDDYGKFGDGPAALTLNNSETGIVSGADRGVAFSSGGIVNNAGYIEGNKHGVMIQSYTPEQNGLIAEVNNSGTIIGHQDEGSAVSFFGFLGNATVMNSGIIQSAGIAINNATSTTGMNITNTETGVIIGDVDNSGGEPAIQSQTKETFQVFDETGLPVLDGDGNPTYDVPVGVDFGDTVDNAGAINGDVNLGLGADSVINSGFIGGTVDLGDGDGDSVINSGNITGDQGIIIQGDNTNITNTGSIESYGGDYTSGENGSAAIKIMGGTGATITNEAGAVIHGDLKGIEVGHALDENGVWSQAAFDTTVINHGSIIGEHNDGVRLVGGGSVYNTGIIQGNVEHGLATDGVSGWISNGTIADPLVGGAAMTVTNTDTGEISGARAGLALSSGGIVDNAGSISGDNLGILIQSVDANHQAIADVTNSGFIWDNGIDPEFEGMTGQPGSAVLFSGQLVDATLTNSGTIEGTRIGVNNNTKTASMTITNEATGVIAGDINGDGAAIQSQTMESFQVFDDVTGDPVLDGEGNPTYDVPVGVDFGDTVNNAGLINGDVNLGLGGDSVVNSGSIEGTVDLGEGDGDSVDNSGTITGVHGIIIEGDNTTITNTGTIDSTGGHPGSGIVGGAGIKIIGGQGTTIINEAGATIHAEMKGIEMGWGADGFSALDTTVINHGTIIGENNDGVRLIGGGSVFNTGTIRANYEVGRGSDGISGWAEDTTGSLIPGTAMVTLNNNATGVVSGAGRGVAFSSGGIVNNDGEINGYDLHGVMIQTWSPTQEGLIGEVNNTGTILGHGIDATGVSFYGFLANATVMNSGIIQAAGTAIDNATRTTGMNVTNTQTGVIHGDVDGDGNGVAIQSQTMERFQVFDDVTGDPVLDGEGNPTYDVPVGVDFGDTVNNAGTINGDVNLGLGTDAVDNSGEIFGTVNLGEGDGDSVNNSGSITGSKGIVVEGSNATIINSGSIESFGGHPSSFAHGDAGIKITGGTGATITNEFGAIIHADQKGIEASGQSVDGFFESAASDTTVINHGTIIGENNDGVRLIGGGSVFNTGTIRANYEVGRGSDGISGWVTHDGPVVGGTAVSVINTDTGDIFGARAGIFFNTGALLDNAGSITGGGAGLAVFASEDKLATANITNSGYIADTDGNPWTLGNVGNGILFTNYLSDINLTNSGTIEGTKNAILNITQNNGMAITNEATGVITGDTNGDSDGAAIQSQTMESFQVFDAVTGDPVLDGEGNPTYDVPVGVDFGDTVDNAGLINGDVRLGLGADAVNNSGQILGTVDLGEGDGDSVDNSGNIEGTHGIIIRGDNTTITNTGSIDSTGGHPGSGEVGGAGIKILGGQGTTIINEAGATIHGNMKGIEMGWGADGFSALDTTVINNGTIIGENNDGIRLTGGGSVTNSGTIRGNVDQGYGTDGVSGWYTAGGPVAGGAAMVVTNTVTGTIFGARAGLALSSGGIVDNAGSITGDHAGMFIQASEDNQAIADVNNSGYIGDTGAGTFGFSITGYGIGFLNQLIDITLVNSGTIEGTTTAIVNATQSASMDITNEASGVITGDSNGDGYGVAIWSITKEDLVATDEGGSPIMDENGNPVYDIPEGASFIDTISNAGLINGNLVMGMGNDVVTNTGTINGGISFGEGNDTYDGTGGVITGEIDGGKGDDNFIGGTGNENYVASSGNDTIDNFTTGATSNDVLDLSKIYTITDFASLLDASTEVNGNTVIDLGRGNTVTLTGVNKVDLHADDFVFFQVPSGSIILGDDTDNHMDGTADDDLIVGYGGNDMLIGNEGNDTLIGGDGQDSFMAGSGDDTIDGGAGNNTVDYGNWGHPGAFQGAYVDLESGTATDTTGGTDTLINIQNVGGSEQGDTLLGDNQNNGLWAGDGDDYIDGRDGNDWLEGGAGNDTLIGGAGNDTFVGGAGIDSYDGGEGNDNIQLDPIQQGTEGVTIDLEAGTLNDAFGNDETIVNVENVDGSNMNDTILGDDGDNWLGGHGGDDIINGRGGNDFILLDGGFDTLVITDGSGYDTVEDFTVGEDTIDLAGTAVGAINLDAIMTMAFNDGEGNTVIDFGGGNVLTLLGVTPDLLTDASFIYGDAAPAQIIDGDEFDNDLYGGNGDDTINGHDGNDWMLHGGIGNDTLDGGAGDDGLEGGAGDDTLIGGSGGDWMEGGSGSDTFVMTQDDGGWDHIEDFSAEDVLDLSATQYGATNMGNILAMANEEPWGVSIDFGDGNGLNLANLTLAELGAMTNIIFGQPYPGVLLDGDEFDNNLEGGRGNDTINGFAGNDWLSGQGGDDVISGGEGDDGLDGGTGNDELYGEEGSDWFNPGAGDDLIVGGNSQHPDGWEDGDYIDYSTWNYEGATMGATVDLAAETGIDPLGGTDTIYGIENLGGGDFADDFRGDDFDNGFNGAGGDDYLEGRGGNDWFDGGDGNDTLIGGSGHDGFMGGAGDDYIDGGSSLDEWGNEHWDSVDYGSWGYEGATQGVFANLMTGEAIDPLGGLDTLVNIEGINGSDLGDTLIGDDQNNAFGGNAGNDTIEGNGGDDWLEGGDGDDTLIGGAGSDGIMGGAGDDYIDGGSSLDEWGNEHWDGVDYSSWGYNNSLEGVYVDLELGIAHDQLGGLDTLVNIESVTGSDGNDDLYGDTNDNGLYGQGGDDELFGNLGNDNLDGGEGNDILYGGHGNDYLHGGAGMDTFVIEMDDGWDHIQDFTDEDTLDLTNTQSGATDLAALKAMAQYDGNGLNIDFGNGNGMYLEGVTLESLDIMTIIYGQPAPDLVIMGDEFDNHLEGGNGNDTISGLAGDDWWLMGNGGNDTIYGEDGNDGLNGGTGNDFLYGGTGADNLVGGAGDDYIDGGTSFDQWGNPEGDTVEYSTWLYEGSTQGVYVNLGEGIANDPFEGTDTLVGIENVMGGDYEDTLVGDDNDNSLSGQMDYDILEGRGGNDGLDGGEGNDILNGGQGDDWMHGGEGSDTFIIFTGDGWDHIEDLSGEDVLDLSNTAYGATDLARLMTMASDNGDGSMRIDFGDGNGLTLANFSVAEMAGLTVLYGQPAPDQIIDGDEFDNNLEGGNGNDTISGLAGNDWLKGKIGNDTLDGGNGWDGANYDDSTAGINADFSLVNTIDDGLGGTDTLISIEAINGSQHNDYLTSGGDVTNLIGNGGNDTLIQGEGNVQLSGGDGDDTLVGNVGTDQTGFHGGQGNDTLDSTNGQGWVSYEDSPNGVIVNLLTGTADDGWGTTDTLLGMENLHGSYLSDTLTLNNDGTYVFARDGDDIINALDGDDSIFAGAGHDTVDGGAGIDWINYQDDWNGDPNTSGPATQGVVVDLGNNTATDNWGFTDTLTNIENVDGSEMGDSITGDANENRIQGNGGNDTINGGGGNDFLIGGAGDDVFVFDDAAGNDTILDFQAGIGTEDFIDFSALNIIDTNGDEIVDINDLSIADNGSGSAVITLDDGSTITLDGVATSSLDNDDFWFGG